MTAPAWLDNPDPSLAQTGCAAPGHGNSFRRCKTCGRPLIDWHTVECNVPQQLVMADRQALDHLTTALATTRRQREAS